ncbi:MAG: 4Fe-4S binding protein [Chloroflexota bacterium]
MAGKLWRKPFDTDKQTTASGTVEIDRDRCKGCGYCTEFCPREVLKMTDELNSKGYTVVAKVDEKKCLGCGLCEIICPEFAIHVSNPNGKKE